MLKAKILFENGQELSANIFSMSPTLSANEAYEFTISGEITETKAMFAVKKILTSGNRTIVFWTDGTKTIVKRANDERPNDYSAFTAALAIKVYGNNSQVKRILDRKSEYQKRDFSTGKMKTYKVVKLKAGKGV